MKTAPIHLFRNLLMILYLCLSAIPPVLALTPLKQDRLPTSDGDVDIFPVEHASFILRWKETTVAVDPVGDLSAYKAYPKANLVLLTDVHQDHLNLKTLSSVIGEGGKIVAPSAVAAMLSPELREKTVILTNGQNATISSIGIEAMPMYNTSQERLKYHVKGRGNGYVLDIGKKRVYISGDTEDIPEMRALKNIDAAFLCMNLPYTMTVDQAASAVNQFKPKVVYPYHSRGSDLERFKKSVADSSGVDVRLLSWYGK
jgi:L-ascorbate metabolism protein UlaG (beta-lactamase superfamily)